MSIAKIKVLLAVSIAATVAWCGFSAHVRGLPVEVGILGGLAGSALASAIGYVFGRLANTQVTNAAP